MEIDSVAISGIIKMLVYLGAFGIVAVAAGRMAGAFQKVKLPLISGFLIIGLISGPEVLPGRSFSCRRDPRWPGIH